MDETFPTDCARLYHPVRLLARGGFGAVWEAEHRALGTPVAVKLFLGGEADPDFGAERFLDEARVTAQLNHPCIVRVLELGVAGDQPWIAYELLPGPTLREHMHGCGAGGVPLDDALQVARAVAAALGDAHERGIVHRDVKPENVLCAGGDRWKVTDFGIAKWGGARVRTRTGVVLGTPTYIAPETLQGLAITPAVDIYALGVMLHEMLAGAPPYPGDQPLEIMRGHLESAVPRLERAGVPERVRRLVERMMAKDPGDRPDATAVRADLALTGAGAPARVSTAPNRRTTTERALQSSGASGLSRTLALKGATAQVTRAVGPLAAGVPSAAPPGGPSVAKGPRAPGLAAVAVGLGGLLSMCVWAALSERAAQVTPEPAPSAAGVTVEPESRREAVTALVERLSAVVKEIERARLPGQVEPQVARSAETALEHALQLVDAMAANPGTDLTRLRAKALLLAVEVAYLRDGGGLRAGSFEGVRSRWRSGDARLLVLFYGLEHGRAPAWLGAQAEALRAYVVARPTLAAPAQRAQVPLWVAALDAFAAQLARDGLGHLGPLLGARYIEGLDLFADGPLPATADSLAFLYTSYAVGREMPITREAAAAQKQALESGFRARPEEAIRIGLGSMSSTVGEDATRRYADQMPLLKPVRERMRRLFAELAVELPVFVRHGERPLRESITLAGSTHAALRCGYRLNVDLAPLLSRLRALRGDPGWLSRYLIAVAEVFAEDPAWCASAIEASARMQLAYPVDKLDPELLPSWFTIVKAPLDLATNQTKDASRRYHASNQLRAFDDRISEAWRARPPAAALSASVAALLAAMRDAERELGLRPR